MNKESKIMTCITGYTIRDIITQANELKIAREDIVNMFYLGGQLFLVYYK